MTLDTKTVLKNIKTQIVDLLKADADVVAVVDDRVYDNDLQVLSLDQFPAITVQIRKITPSSKTSGFRFDKIRFMVRGYSEVFGRTESEIDDEQIDLAGSIIDMFTVNYTLDGLCTDTDIVDGDFQFYQDRETLQITRQCVEFTIDCHNFSMRV
jgi:hypothetical protein